VAIFGRDRGGRHGSEPEAYQPDEYEDDEDDQVAGGYYDDQAADEYDGPYDEDEVPDDGLARLDLGSVRIPLPPDAQVQVEMDPAGPLRAVHVLTPNGRFTVSAYAAPRSGGLWAEVSSELADQLDGDGARVRREIGAWGTELVAFVNDVLLRFVGADGPRWMLRAVSAGPKETSAQAAKELRDIVRGTVVVRGPQPMPVRTPLALTLPDEIAQHIEQAKTEQ
jgi:Protein of unknown function (DUF3710)